MRYHEATQVPYTTRYAFLADSIDTKWHFLSLQVAIYFAQTTKPFCIIAMASYIAICDPTCKNPEQSRIFKN